MTTQLATIDEMQSMAGAMVKSKMFGFKTVEEAMSIMMIAQAEGRPAALAARDYHVIQGRPALKADAMLARFQAEGGVVEWDEYTDTKVTGRFSHPKSCPKPVSISWTLDMAKRIGLLTKDNWRNYPRAMMRARVISEGVRTTYPGIAVGIYTVEEVQDLKPERDITPRAGAGDSLSEERRVEIADLADKVREWLNSGSLTDAWMEIDNATLEIEERIFLSSHFDSKTRRQLTEEGDRQRIKNAPAAIESKAINEAQKKRLEARIGEIGIKRDAVKAYCANRFLVEHFSELNTEQYNELDQWLETQAAPAHTPPDGDSPASAPDAAPDDALLIKAREFAECGTERYADWFKNVLTKEQRAHIGTARHEELKAIAAKVTA